MAKSELNVTSFDAEELKLSLIAFLQSTNEFGDFDYEGSAINTIVDLLVRNSTYTAYLANMLANESFIDSAQLRSNVVSHAQKLSYTPRSAVSARTIGSIEVVPTDVTGVPITIELPQGTVFLSSVGGQTYSFVTNNSYLLDFDGSKYTGSDIELFQGQLLTNRFVYAGDPIEIPNSLIDTSSITVLVTDNGEDIVYNEATSLSELSSSSNFYFISENHRGRYQIEFGRDILGNEPSNSSVIAVTYILTEEDHANGVNSFIPGSTVSGYSDITFTANDPAWGGADKETIEDIRFIAPKMYQAQGRALTDTDYIPLIKSEYPFIRSVITWGGEDNDPPQYGKVFMSFISDEGAFLTESVKDSIVEYLSDYNVGSITPEIVDPVGFGLDLVIKFSYDNRLTSKTFNQLSNDIHSIINDYNSQQINEFGKFFNDSYLIDRIMGLRGMISVDIDTLVYRQLDVLTFTDPIYNVVFDNEIVPGTVSMVDFKVDVNGLNHRLYDDSNGSIFVEFERGGSTITQDVGDVNYDTGDISFIINMIQDTNTVKVYAEPVKENFYIEQNKYLFIDDVDFEPLRTGRS